MPRYDDEDDDRPRRRPARDEDDDDRPRRRRPADDADDTPRSRRRPADDEDDDLPRRRRTREDDDDFASVRPKQKSKLGLVLGILGGAFLLCCGGGGFGAYYFFGSIVGEGREQRESANNLKEIGIALHNYHDVNGGLPTNTVGPNGPLLSWRVHILPYLGEQGLYSQFKLNEPWDSPNNKRLLDQMPRVYATPAERRGSVPKGNKTYYRGFSNPGAAFAPRPGPAFPGPPGVGGPGGGFGPGGPPGWQPPAVGLSFANITDGTSNTIAVVEAGDPVEWTKPDDLDASPGKPFPKLGGVRPKSDGILVLTLDGGHRIIRRNTPETTLRALVSVSGGEVVSLD